MKKIYIIFFCLSAFLSACVSPPAWTLQTVEEKQRRTFYTIFLSLAQTPLEKAEKKAYQEAVDQISQQIGAHVQSKWQKVSSTEQQGESASTRSSVKSILSPIRKIFKSKIHQPQERENLGALLDFVWDQFHTREVYTDFLQWIVE